MSCGTGCRAVRRGALLAMVLLLSSFGSVGVIVAASPPPSPGETPEPLPTGELVVGHGWLDAALPLDAPAGSTISVGVLPVDFGDGGLVVHGTMRPRLYPATGDGAPSVGTAIPDWPGHYQVTVEVPIGGVGRLTIGLVGQFCNDSGCAESDFVYEPLEVGPPVGLPLSSVATARLVGPPSLIARQPATFEVDITPRVAWPAGGLAMPDTLFLEVRVPRGPVVTEVPIANSSADPTRYSGSVTLIEPGDYVVQVASVTNPTEAQLFSTAIVAVTVDPATIPTAPSTGGGWPDWWPLALAAAGLAVSALLIYRGRART